MNDGNWWDVLPRKIYSSLEMVETNQPWYSVYRLHDWLYAILEDGQYDEALMYLVIGEKKAVIIDGGTGIGRLSELVTELTNKPVFLLLTHTHNDHIGSCSEFTEIALYDDKMSWESAAKGLGKEKMGEMLEGDAVIKVLPPGFDPDDFYAPPYRVTHWLQDEDVIDLGGRKLRVLHTPGHSSNHLCLLDHEARYLYTGDIYYTGAVTTYLPGGDHYSFIESCKRLVELMPFYDWLMPAHNEPLVEKNQIVEMYHAANDIITGRLREYTERRSIAVNYDVQVRKYQFERFSLTVREDLFY